MAEGTKAGSIYVDLEGRADGLINTLRRAGREVKVTADGMSKDAGRAGAAVSGIGSPRLGGPTLTARGVFPELGTMQDRIDNIRPPSTPQTEEVLERGVVRGLRSFFGVIPRFGGGGGGGAGPASPFGGGRGGMFGGGFGNFAAQVVTAATIAPYIASRGFGIGQQIREAYADTFNRSGADRAAEFGLFNRELDPHKRQADIEKEMEAVNAQLEAKSRGGFFTRLYTSALYRDVSSVQKLRDQSDALNRQLYGPSGQLQAEERKARLRGAGQNIEFQESAFRSQGGNESLFGLEHRVDTTPIIGRLMQNQYNELRRIADSQSAN